MPLLSWSGTHWLELPQKCGSPGCSRCGPAGSYLRSGRPRWLDSLLRSEAAASSAVAVDRELTRIDRLLIGFAATGWASATAALEIVAMREQAANDQRLAAVVALVVTAVAFGCALLLQRRHTDIRIRSVRARYK